MNRSQEWEQEHFRKILNELQEARIKLARENIPQIIHETSFQVRSKKFGRDDREGCAYYDKGKPCHPVQELNCLLCSCPNYESDKLDGGCRINSRFGKMHYHKNLPLGRVWDCSDCTNAHSPEYVARWLDENIENLESMAGLVGV